MDDPNSATSRSHSGLPPFVKAIIGGDEDTLRRCPPSDIAIFKSIAWLAVLNWIFEASLLTIAGHHLFAPPGILRPEIVIGAIFLATFILMMDIILFVRNGFYDEGVAELKRCGGVDISGGLVARFGAFVSLIVRMILAVGLAMLNALVVATVVFATDIDKKHLADYQAANRGVITAAAKRADQGTQRLADATADQEKRVVALANQVTALRQGQIDPYVNDPRMQETEAELKQLLARQTQADDDVRAKETTAADEMGGVKTPTTSGRPGRNIRYQAAVEDANNAKRRAQQITTAVDAARGRLDALRAQAQPDDAANKRAADQLANFEGALDRETARLNALKTELNASTSGREVAIRRAVDETPEHVEMATGFLASITTLRKLADDSWEIKVVVAFLDLVAFGLEMSLALCQLTRRTPAFYSVLVARDAFMRTAKVADDMAADLNNPVKPNGRGPGPSAPHAANDDQKGFDFGFGLFKSSAGVSPDSSKRKRGRPRKYPPPATGPNGQGG